MHQPEEPEKALMKDISRRKFIKTMAASGAYLSLGHIAPGSSLLDAGGAQASATKPIVSIVRIKKGNIDYAVRHAIDLLGGMGSITQGKERILLKPNLVGPDPRDVTKPDVVKVLAQLMNEAGKDVSMGEGSAAATRSKGEGAEYGGCRATDRDMIDAIQEEMFGTLGYRDLAKSLKIPLINLHTGRMTKVPLPSGFVFKEISLHHSLTDTDMLCSVPMMKTHGLATVTLGMKNLFGVYPGQIYGTPRWGVHHEAAKVERSGTASAIIDMVRANKLGLTVIDASKAMQGTGPTVRGGGRIARMNLIIAGMNPLATDMVAAYTMGFQPEEISTFAWAWKAGMAPRSLSEIEVRGRKIKSVRQKFARPLVLPFSILDGLDTPC
jgi:uncharacterized protein (DUF362 family)